MAPGLLDPGSRHVGAAVLASNQPDVDEVDAPALTVGMRRPRQVTVRDTGPQTTCCKAKFAPGSSFAKGADEAASPGLRPLPR